MVGEPPWIQAFALAVWYPSPNVLSRNAHRNSKPIASRKPRSPILPTRWLIGVTADACSPAGVAACAGIRSNVGGSGVEIGG